MTKDDKLKLWQERAARNASEWESERSRMDEREVLYRGEEKLRALTEKSKKLEENRKPRHVRNIIAENVESMVDSNIPQPKVTPRRKQDEKKAEIIENMIRNELDRLPMEEINDMLERMVPIQGAGLYLVEWDETQRRHSVAGEVVVTAVHPKQLIPQAGVNTSIEDMDYVILMMPQTKTYIKARYGVDVEDASEEAGVRGLDDDSSTAEDMVTQYIAYYRDERGNIGLFSWVDDTVVEDLEDYQARRRRRCTKCGEPEPIDIGEPELPQENEQDAAIADDMLAFAQEFELETEPVEIDRAKPETRDTKKRCPNCGNDVFEMAPMEWEEIFAPFTTSHGVQIPGAHRGLNADGRPAVIPTRIPVYKPNVYPIIMQRNVTVFGRLLGDSDVDKIEDQQHAVNWTQHKLDERLHDAGTMVTLPPDTRAYLDPDDNRVFRVESPSDAAMINTYEFTGQDLAYYQAQLANDYEAARQILGITDSFQGRRDTTATSGTAKQFAAAQSAGRLESKRRMKQAAYARLFELIFKFRLAYADEPRPVVYQDGQGKTVYDSFDRYDFLEFDEKQNQWYWNDQFLFSCDTAAPLASNREALWQEARLNFTSGAYGDPAMPETRILFWTEMERLHYPLAAQAKRALQDQYAAMPQPMPTIPNAVPEAPIGNNTGTPVSITRGNGEQTQI